MIFFSLLLGWDSSSQEHYQHKLLGVLYFERPLMGYCLCLSIIGPFDSFKQYVLASRK